MKFLLTLTVAASLLANHARAQGVPSRRGVRGDSAAVAAAEHLLNLVGGRTAWAHRTLLVEERGYLRSGDAALITITRDFEGGARLLRRVSSRDTLIEWLAPSGGWVNRNGVVTALPATLLAIELQGLRQEPYAVYHRLAHYDSTLRVERRDNALFVYEAGERLLCWLNLDGRGGLTGWGNFYDGAINQHWYGPLISFGNANLPKFGAQSTGNFRFEYLAAHLHNKPLREPNQ